MLLLALLLASAHASGFYVPDAGVRALGRGSACTAGVDDLSAQWWNPAGLSRIDRVRVGLELGVIAQTVQFERAPTADLTFDRVTNRAAPLAAPRIAAAFPITDRFTLALGVYTPYAPQYRYPDDGAQRSLLTRALITQINAGPAASYDFGKVTVGLGLAWSALTVRQSLVSSTALDSSDDPLYDVQTDIRAQDLFAPSGSLGVLIDPVPALTIGLSALPPITYNAQGSLSTDYSGNAFFTGEGGTQQVIAVDSATDPDITLPLRLPMIARAGVLVRPTEALEIEADFVYERWSTFREQRITGMDLEIPTTGGETILVTQDVNIPTPMDDAWSVRLGGELAAGDAVDLRLGGLFEKSATPESARSVQIPDGDKAGYGLGFTWKRERFDLDLGFSQSFSLSPLIDQSALSQISIDPLSGRVDAGVRAGNGRLSSQTHILAVGFAWKGPPPKSP